METRNWLDPIGLQHFAEVSVDGGDGQPEPEPAAAAVADPAVLPGEPSAPFYEYEDPSGAKSVYKDSAELTEAMKKSFMMQKDYTSKTTALSEQSARVKTREAELEKHAEELKGLGEQYKKFRDFMNARPDTFQKFKALVQSPPSPEESYSRSVNYTDGQLKEIKEMVDELKKYRADQEFETEKQSLYGELKNNYSDFDSAEVEKTLGALTDNPKALLELAYFAQRGRLDPVEMERRAAETVEKKRREPAGVIPGTGRPVKKQEFADLADARRAAHEAT